jgi:hypothetical protein
MERPLSNFSVPNTTHRTSTVFVNAGLVHAIAVVVHFLVIRVATAVIRGRPPATAISGIVKTTIGVAATAGQSRNMAQTFISHEKVPQAEKLPWPSLMFSRNAAARGSAAPD